MLSLTIQILHGVAKDNVLASSRSKSQGILEIGQEMKMHVGAKLDFVKNMRAKNHEVLLCFFCQPPNYHMQIWAYQMSVSFFVLLDWSCMMPMVFTGLCIYVVMLIPFTIEVTLLQERIFA